MVSPGQETRDGRQRERCDASERGFYWRPEVEVFSCDATHSTEFLSRTSKKV